MKTHTLLYCLGAALMILGAVLQITHTIDRSLFYVFLATSLLLGTLGDYLRKRKVKQTNE